MALPFLDTNIFVNHLLQLNPEQGERASGILERIEAGDLTVQISDIVVFETVFTLQRAYRVPREEIAANVLQILELPGIVLPAKAQYRRVFELYLSSAVGFADCYHAVLMQRRGVTEVISFDKDFDKLPGINRVES